MRLEKYSPGNLVLREQPDKEATIAQIASMLNQLAKLYQIPNFTGENAVLLSKWIISKYAYETLDVVLDCLVNPPSTGEKNWRLTPDTIQEWFAIKLEEQAIKREREYQKEKQRLREIESTPNFPDFDKLLEGTWYEQAKREQEFDQEKMKQIKEEWLKNRNGNNNS